MEENAILYCEGALSSLDGKISHALIRSSERYKIVAVVDSTHEGMDAGKVLDGKKRKIPVLRNLEAAQDWAKKKEIQLNRMVLGMEFAKYEPTETVIAALHQALEQGLEVDAGLLYLPENLLPFEAKIRLPLRKGEIPTFSGKVQAVNALKIAVLGTDHGVGKHTTAWQIMKTLHRQGIPTQMIGTSLTSWLRGAGHNITLETTPKSFQSGELEDAAYKAWESGARVLIIEGYGSLLHPANPGGTEILNTLQPDLIVLQHAAGRAQFWGYPSYKMPSLARQVKAIEAIAGKPVDALTIHPGKVEPKEGKKTVKKLAEKTGLPAWDVIAEGPEALVAHLMNLARNLPPKNR